MHNGMFPSVKRIVAIGDIHGDFQILLKVLKKLGIINNENNWIAGNTYLVQLGDIVDGRSRIGEWKGDNEKQIIEFLLFLDQKARAYHGRVITLIGNHEIMNMIGNYSYASENGIKKMGGIQGRKSFFNSKNSIFRKFVLNSYLVVKIGDWIFCHAGFTDQKSSAYTIPYINNMFKQFIQNKLNNNAEKKFINLVLGNNGILTYRGYGKDKPPCKNFYSAVNNLNGRFMVIGHTVQPDINSACRNRLWRIDTAMSRAFGPNNVRRISGLEIINNGQYINKL